MAFQSYATNLVTGDDNGSGDIFPHDRQTGTTALVSVDSAGARSYGYSYRPSISADGRYVAFDSDGTKLVPNDTNGSQDVFVRSLGEALVITKKATPNPAWAGEPLTYTLTVSETGGLFDATDMVVSDTVPLSTSCCLSISHGGFHMGGDVLWVGQTISSGHSISLTFVVTVSELARGAVITNEAYQAVITNTNGLATATGSPVNTAVRGVPQLSIGKSAPLQVPAGNLLTYTIVVSETGGLEDAAGMQVTDTVPASTTCCAAIGQGGTLVGNDVVWTGQTVRKGSSISRTFVVTVSQVPSGTIITNEAYGAVITTTKWVTGASGSPVLTVVYTGPPAVRPLAVYLPLILKSQ